MAQLFDSFPFLENKQIVIRKMTDADVDALDEITSNENVYRYIPPFLYKKARAFCSRPSETSAVGILKSASSSSRACICAMSRSVVSLLVRYLSDVIGIPTLYAYVMPENLYSGKALLRNGFVKQAKMAEEKNWGGQEHVQVEVYAYRRKT